MAVIKQSPREEAFTARQLQGRRGSGPCGYRLRKRSGQGKSHHLSPFLGETHHHLKQVKKSEEEHLWAGKPQERNLSLAGA